jgi:hypothetical protein
MKSNLKFAIDICDVQQNIEFDIPHAANLDPLVEKAWGSSYLYYLVSGPHMLLGNIANHGKAKSFERGFLLFVVFPNFYNHAIFRASIPRISPERCILAQSNACSNAPKAMKNRRRTRHDTEKSRAYATYEYK